MVLAGEYRVRPGAGTSRGSISEDANTPALSPYEMRTRKRIVHIMKVSAKHPHQFFEIALSPHLHHHDHHTSRSIFVL
jgi:hypothetical protein